MPKSTTYEFSFPITGGTAVSNDTLSAHPHRFAFRRTGSENCYSIVSWYYSTLQYSEQSPWNQFATFALTVTQAPDRISRVLLHFSLT